MLESFGHLQPGDWVLQNAANSSVGVSLIQIAKTKGLRTVNVVRRAQLVDHLAAFGADVTLVDGADLPARVAKRSAAAGSSWRSTPSPAMQRAGWRTVLPTAARWSITACCRASPVKSTPPISCFAISACGASGIHAGSRPPIPREIRSVFGRLAGMLQAKTLRVPLEASYPIERLTEALAHAEREGRLGKVVLQWLR